MQFNVKEVFRTLQGEGANMGTPSVFIRLGGCNIWSGKEKDRVRDAEKSNARCPSWCDTDFTDGTLTTTDDLVIAVRECGGLTMPLIVITGGEPMLQVNVTMLQALKSNFKHVRIAIETNGTKRPTPEIRNLIDWICVSPKTPADTILLNSGDELKVVFPAYNPKDYTKLVPGFRHHYVSPLATSGRRSVIVQDNVDKAIQFVMENPQWKLSMQTHKMNGLP